MSQSREIPETERAKFTRDPPDGSIRSSFDISDFYLCTSDEVEDGGLKWCLGIDKKSLNEKEFLYVSLIPQDLVSPPWNIELTAEFILHNKSDPNKNVSQMHHYVLRDELIDASRIWIEGFTFPGCYLMPWDEMIDRKKGFVGDGKIDVQIRLSIMHGLRCNPAFDFSSSVNIRSDIVLMIEGKPVHVNKEYLALYSPVFRTMFFGDSTEKGKNEFVLEDVDNEDFIELLHVIYPCQRNITETYAESLIQLAQRFQIPSVIERAEDALIKSDEVKREEKIRIGDKYQLFRLLECGLSEIYDVEDAYDVRDDPCYGNLSDATKIALRQLKIGRANKNNFWDNGVKATLILETERSEYTRDPPDGIIEDHFCINMIALGCETDSVRIGGLLWQLGVDKKSLDKKEFLYVGLIPQDLKSPPWNIELTAEFILRHDSDPNKNVSQMHHYILRDEFIGVRKIGRKDLTFPGCYLMPWDEIREKGFVENAEISVEIRLSILKGLSCKPVFDFSSSGNIHSDAVLVIEGKPVHINKQYLGFYSPFFQTMFFGEFAEKGKDVIELKDADREEFIELLHVIYPSQKTITARSAEYLIELADRFQITSVIHRAEDVFISSYFDPTEGMQIADQYKLYRLLEHCLSRLRKIEDIHAIKNDPIFESFSETTKAALHERELEVMGLNLCLINCNPLTPLSS